MSRAPNSPEVPGVVRTALGVQLTAQLLEVGGERFDIDREVNSLRRSAHTYQILSECDGYQSDASDSFSPLKMSTWPVPL